MSIIIKGLEMPKENAICIVIFPDGKVTSQFGVPHLGTAVPVPPHGRLGDLDALYWRIKAECNPYGAPTISYDDGLKVLNIISSTPPIIPAEGMGYILAPQEEYCGLKRKYVVLKSDSGEPVEGCFVLRPDKDKTAIAAILAYANATDNQVLAKDIREWISTLPADKEGEGA